MMDSLLPDQLKNLAQLVVTENSTAKRKIATAESCTGGLVSAAITEISGSSAVLDRAFVTYSNEAKQEMLGVPKDKIAQNGAVSLPVVRAMAIGAISNSNADIAVSISGIAGPKSDDSNKPVGMVAFALADKDGIVREAMEYFGEDLSRAEIRLKAALLALNWLRV